VSTDPFGYGGDQNSGLPSISGDGRYIAFLSLATNLVIGDTNNRNDVFLHDRQTGITTRVSVDSIGNEANDHSYRPVISEDGRFIAFSSKASNLVGDDTNGYPDVFLHDQTTGITRRVSIDDNGNEANSQSSGPSISQDGRYIAFESVATNLISGGSSVYRARAFVYDRVSEKVIHASIDSAGNEANDSSVFVSISGNGQYVMYFSAADNLVPGDTNGLPDVFVHDLLSGTTSRASVDSTGNQSNGSSVPGAISYDGRYVVFQSAADNLVTNDLNYKKDIFVHDRVIGTTSRASLTESGIEANGDSSEDPANKCISIASNGRYVAFDTRATNFISFDVNGYNSDIVVRAIPEILVDSIVPDQLTIGATTSITISGKNFLDDVVPLMLTVEGSAFSNLIIVDENTLTVDMFIPATASEGLQGVTVTLPGSGPGTMTGATGECTDCVSLVKPSGC
tara:strand:- start:30 stop:1388 length:1359 start_codon:yes stop_codon:yes gene_type:complete